MDMHFPLPSRLPSSPRSQETVPITWLSLVIYVQFGLGAVLVLYTLLGISIGHEIGRLLLLAVLQIVIAVPGSVYTFRKEGPLLLVYVAAQAWTGASELIWIVIHLVGGGDVATAFLLGILAFIQFFSVGTVFCCRERIVFRHRKDDLDTHLRVSATKNPTTAELTMSAEVAQQPRLEKTSPKKSQTSQRQAPGETTTTEQNKPTQDIRPADEGNGDKVPERVKEIRKLIDAMNARVEKRSQESLRTAGGVIFATVFVDVLPHVQWLYGTHYTRTSTLPLTYVLICVGFVVSFILAEITRRLADFLDFSGGKRQIDSIQRVKRQRELAKRQSINTLVALVTFSVALGVHSEIRHFELLTSSSHRIAVILSGTLLRKLVALIPFLRVEDAIRQALLSIIMALTVFTLHMVVVYVTVINVEKLPDYKQTTLQIVFESSSSGVLLYISLIELMAKQRGDCSLLLKLGVFILTLGGMTVLHVFLRRSHYQQPMADALISSNYSCDAQQQSPIDFGASLIFYRSDTDPSSVQWLDWTPDDIEGMEVPKAHGDYHGFTIHFVPKPKSRLTASHLKGSYQPYNFHMHWQFYNDSRMRGQGSEHTVKGYRYPGEMHAVFFNDKYDSFEDAQGKKGGVIVLGTFAAIGNFHNVQFHQMENAIVSVMPNGGAVPESVLGFLDLPGLLPQNRQFYTYTGSLTTPRYSPCVQWTVFTEPIRISSDQYELLFDMIYELKNARDGQPIVGPVYASFEPDEQ